MDEFYLEPVRDPAALELLPTLDPIEPDPCDPCRMKSQLICVWTCLTT